MAELVIQQAPPAQRGAGSQILIGALAGVLAWWLIETIHGARREAADDDDDD